MAAEEKLVDLGIFCGDGVEGGACSGVFQKREFKFYMSHDIKGRELRVLHAS